MRIEPTPKGILPSQLEWLTQYLGRQHVEHVYESGRANAMSTQWLAHYGYRVTSYETNPVVDVDAKLLEQYGATVSLIHSDGMLMVQRVQNSFACGERIAVLLDGPKGSRALMLAKRLLPFVALVAIHDMDVKQPSRKRCDNMGAVYSQDFDESPEGMELNAGWWEGTYSSPLEYSRVCTMALIRGEQWR